MTVRWLSIQSNMSFGPQNLAPTAYRVVDMRRVQEQNRFLAVGGAESWPALSSLTTIVGVTARVTYGFLTPHGTTRLLAASLPSCLVWVELSPR
jgi:hypothetical protein